MPGFVFIIILFVICSFALNKEFILMLLFFSRCSLLCSSALSYYLFDHFIDIPCFGRVVYIRIIYVALSLSVASHKSFTLMRMPPLQRRGVPVPDLPDVHGGGRELGHVRVGMPEPAAPPLHGRLGSRPQCPGTSPPLPALQGALATQTPPSPHAHPRVHARNPPTSLYLASSRPDPAPGT